MKRPALFLLPTAALVLGWIALRSPGPTWSAPPAEVLPESVPVALGGEVPAGYVVRRFQVEGMCCSGCPKKVYAHLAALPGVCEVAVDPILQQVAAVVPAERDVASLEAALTFDKYSAKVSE